MPLRYIEMGPAIISVILTLLSPIAVRGATIYSNIDFFSNSNSEPMCSMQQEHFIESDGIASSVMLEFTAGITEDTNKSCTRILSAPSNYGFIVRLMLPKRRRSGIVGVVDGTALPLSSSSLPSSAATAPSPSAKPKFYPATALNDMTSLIEKLNATALKSSVGRMCPMSIFSSHDPHTPQWRVDPCQLEDNAPEMEDPVRLFHGRVRIVWEHEQQSLQSKLMVTALGKGEQCRSENKHQCLKIGDDPILCISKELVCDGVRHCPNSNEYDSDEDYAMCWKQRRYGEPIPPVMESEIFEHFALEVFRNLFAFDVPTILEKPTGKSNSKTPSMPPTNAKSTPVENKQAAPSLIGTLNTTTLRKVDINKIDTDASIEATTTTKADITNESVYRRNSTRSGLNSDLSKYGPWGYLMLGMLLCGGALLICGLWASASQQAAQNEREAAQNGGGNERSGNGPPNYDELDPPPAYSMLFPNQKGPSSNTLSPFSLTAPSNTAVPATGENTTTNETTNAALNNANGTAEASSSHNSTQAIT